MRTIDSTDLTHLVVCPACSQRFLALNHEKAWQMLEHHARCHNAEKLENHARRNRMRNAGQ